MIDKDTFCEQIRLHEKAMYYLAFSLVQNEADAADVIGEATHKGNKEADHKHRRGQQPRRYSEQPKGR